MIIYVIMIMIQAQQTQLDVKVDGHSRSQPISWLINSSFPQLKS